MTVLLLLLACPPAPVDSADTEAPSLSWSTADQLEAFYAPHGGRDAFPSAYIDAIETLLLSEDEVAQGEHAAAAERIEALFAERPVADTVWMEDTTLYELNVGSPLAYYGNRMLQPITTAGVLEATDTLTLTVVVAPCAEVSRPTLPNLEPETVDLDVDPALLADDAAMLHQVTHLFGHWVLAITGGSALSLQVVELSTCTTVTFGDDGSTITSYPDVAGMIEAADTESDMWWVVAPSGVPGDGSGYDRHFITGGMGGTGLGAPVFISDDAWLIRKPEHLGSGEMSDVERRVYLPQWFQHEFMHHLFATWPELGLEDTSHQWFDRDTWPADFEGIYEADYYSEAIDKRFGDVDPTLAEGLSIPSSADLDALGLDALAGDYAREPVENDWHEVSITVEDDALTWTNAAGVSWSLEVDDGRLYTGSDCPYGVSELLVELEDDVVAALWFGGEPYRRQ